MSKTHGRSLTNRNSLAAIIRLSAQCDLATEENEHFVCELERVDGRRARGEVARVGERLMDERAVGYAAEKAF